jgi:hypothetical protein
MEDRCAQLEALAPLAEVLARLVDVLRRAQELTAIVLNNRKPSVLYQLWQNLLKF